MVQAEGKNIVVDAGPDFRQQMLRTGIARLDGLIFTHAHKDHLAGLDDVRGFNFVMKEAIDVYCTEKVEEQIRTEFHYIFAETKYPGIPELNIHHINKFARFEVAGVPVTPIEVLHYRLPVLGFRFGGFVYITDANFISEEEKEKIRGCDTLVLNALRIEKHISHFTLDEAIAMAEELKPRVTYFTHISHQLGRHEEVEQKLPSHIRLAYDGLQINI